jgi:hypothetical protein
MKYAVRPLLLSILFVAALGCDKATPTAPSGSILTISANPSVVTSANGTSTITVTGRRSNGSPLADGTEIRLSTNLGSIDSLVTLDRNGTATALLRGDGRVGKATVTASAGTTTGSSGGSGSGSGTGSGTGSGSGSSSGSSSGVLTASIDVEIGSSAKTMTLQATPTNIPVAQASQVKLVALVRDARGLPLADTGVNFTTEYGKLASGGRLVYTNAQGVATDTLNITKTDLTNEPPSVKVTAQTADSSGALVSSTFDIQVRTDRLEVRFTYAKGTGQYDVVFRSVVTGGSSSLTYSWVFGDGSSSTDANPTHTYPPQEDTYTVILTVRDTATGLSDVATAQVKVPVTVGGNSS